MGLRMLTNVKDTSQRTCRCGTWMRHWLRFSGQTAPFCAADGCMERDPVGAHVKEFGGDGTCFIVPLCQSHNQDEGIVFVADDWVLVPATPNNRCGR